MQLLRSLTRRPKSVVLAAFSAVFGAGVNDQLWTWFN
jgi:hypothetical protein